MYIQMPITSCCAGILSVCSCVPKRSHIIVIERQYVQMKVIFILLFNETFIYTGFCVKMKKKRGCLLLRELFLTYYIQYCYAIVSSCMKAVGISLSGSLLRTFYSNFTEKKKLCRKYLKVFIVYRKFMFLLFTRCVSERNLLLCAYFIFTLNA